jgi:hypothetical protein
LRQRRFACLHRSGSFGHARPAEAHRRWKITIVRPADHIVPGIYLINAGFDQINLTGGQIDLTRGLVDLTSG